MPRPPARHEPDRAPRRASSQERGGDVKPKRIRKSEGAWVKVPKAILAAPAWRAMSAEARLLWLDVRGWLRNDGLNNGNVHRSCRDAAKSLGFNKDTITRRFVELEHYGFLFKTG